jgi:RimJ/RimL family protein N-acetyltransferase
MTEAPMTVAPVTLEGRLVRLEPLSRAHPDGLAEVGLDPELWRWTLTRIVTREDLDAYLETALAAAAAGTELPFATIERASGRPIGSTRYLNIDRHHRRLEIGYTWLGRAWQRSGANTEAKLLMLEHAFDALGCHRVEFKTDSLNEQSRAALLGIGATLEGIFRNHMVSQGGRLRHSAYYSIVAEEWPSVRARLRDRLARHDPAHRLAG